MTPQHQATLNDGGEIDIAGDGGSSVRISLLARFPDEVDSHSLGTCRGSRREVFA